MKAKANTHYWLTVVMAVLAVVMAISAVLLWLIFPRGYIASRELWLGIHKWVGLSIAVGILLHVVLHWSWLVQMTRRYLRIGRNRGPEKD